MQGLPVKTECYTVQCLSGNILCNKQQYTIIKGKKYKWRNILSH
jgi:hypothetical protein